MSLFKNKNKNKTSVIKFKNANKNNHLEIIYFDMGKPFIFIKVFNKNKLKNTKEIPILNTQIENGIILNTESIIQELKELVGKTKYSIDLKIASSTIFRSVISLPKVSANKAEKLKKKEIKDSYGKFNKNYRMIEDKYHYNLGVVYEETFINNDVVKNWIEISKGSNLRLSTIQIFNGYLFDLIRDKKDFRLIDPVSQIESVSIVNNKKSKKKKNKNKNKRKKNKMPDFALIYVKNGVASFVLSSSSQLINGYSFEYTSEEEIIKKFLLIIGKHEIEFEKKPIEDIYIESDIDLSLNETFKDIQIHNIHFLTFDGIEKPAISRIEEDEKESSNELQKIDEDYIRNNPLDLVIKEKEDQNE